MTVSSSGSFQVLVDLVAHTQSLTDLAGIVDGCEAHVNALKIHRPPGLSAGFSMATPRLMFSATTRPGIKWSTPALLRAGSQSQPEPEVNSPGIRTRTCGHRRR